jgi:hypothetical protein
MNEGEKRVVSKMIFIYCRFNHDISRGLCEECTKLHNYAWQRLERCLYGEKKPTCSSCPIHCYKEDKRLQIQNVMRFSGKRMLFFYPVDAIRYLIKNI